MYNAMMILIELRYFVGRLSCVFVQVQQSTCGRRRLNEHLADQLWVISPDHWIVPVVADQEGKDRVLFSASPGLAHLNHSLI